MVITKLYICSHEFNFIYLEPIHNNQCLKALDIVR